MTIQSARFGVVTNSAEREAVTAGATASRDRVVS